LEFISWAIRFNGSCVRMAFVDLALAIPYTLSAWPAAISMFTRKPNLLLVIVTTEMVFPVQCGAHDKIQIVVPWLPSKLGFGHRWIRHDRGRIARTAADKIKTKIPSGHSLHGIDNIKNRESATISTVCNKRSATATHSLQRLKVRVCEIRYMDVISDTGPVRRRVICTINIQLRPFAECCLAGDLDQMSCPCSRLAGTAVRVCAGNVEVSQGGIIEGCCCSRVCKHNLGHQFRRSVGRFWT